MSRLKFRGIAILLVALMMVCTCTSDYFSIVRSISSVLMADESTPPDIVPDTLAPSSPTNLTIVSQTYDSVSLTWNASTDDSGVVGYIVYKNGMEYGVATETNYTDNGLSPANNYTYSVKALDQYGNLSDASNEVLIQIPEQPVTPPAVALSAPSNLSITSQTYDSVSLFWSASTGGTGVVTYVVYRNDEQISTTNDTAYSDSGLVSGTSYVYCVKAVDATGTESEASNQVTWSDQNNQSPGGNDSNSGGAGGGGGTISPNGLTSPVNLAVYEQTSSSVTLTWDAATGTVNYVVYRDGNEIGTVINNAYTDSGLTVGTTYKYIVKAVDEAGNVSQVSNEVTVQIPAIETVTPPSNLQAVVNSFNSVSLSWTAPSSENIVAYVVYRNGESITTVIGTAYVDTKLPVATTYSYTVKAVDTDGKISLGSNEAFVTLPALQIKKVPLAAGDSHSLIVKSDGKVWSWGSNGGGQLGSGTAQSTIPVKVLDLVGIQAVSGGYYHSLALDSNGWVWAWGANSSGELGIGSELDSSKPEKVQNLEGIIAIEAGNSYSLALKNDGTVWAWGSNYNGIFGNNELDESNVPVQINGLAGVVAIAAGQSHCLALMNDGTVWGWGSNSEGQLADNNDGQPARISNLSGITAIAAGGYHSLALASNGVVWSWGNNASGQLGIGMPPYSAYQPTAMNISGIKAIAAGEEFSLALKDNGSVVSFGANWGGQLGNDSTYQWQTYGTVSQINNVTSIACGDTHGLAVESSGKVWAWGWNSNGQLGNGTTTQSIVPVTLVDSQPPTAPKNLAMTNMTESSLTLVWEESDDFFGVTGYDIYRNGTKIASTSSTGYVDTSINKDSIYSYTVKAFDAAGNYSSASNVASNDVMPPSAPTNLTVLDVTGSLVSLSWTVSTDNGAVTGYKILRNGIEIDSSATNSYIDNNVLAGETYVYCVKAFDAASNLSDSSNEVSVTTAALNINKVYLSAGGNQSAWLKNNGRLFIWGSNVNDLDYSAGDLTIPTELPIDNVAAVADGSNHIVYLKNNGSVWVSGANWDGQLGKPGAGESSPIQVPGVGGIIAVASNNNHTLALRATGKVCAWGNNSYGQCGTGDTSSPSLPADVKNLTDVISIACGESFSIALKSNGEVVAWGRNDYGQLGNGTTAPSYTPVNVKTSTGNLTGVIAIAAGSKHALALLANGTVYAWGYNYYFQLGYSAYNYSARAQQVSGLTGVTAIAAGYYHSLALKSNGEVWGWGRNIDGQLGTGSTSWNSALVKVKDLSGVIAIAAGNSHSLGLRSDEKVFAWGYNGYGQLGNGTKSPISYPVPVGDSQPPAAPGNLVVNSTSTTSSLKWDAAQDNVGVIGYEVYRNGEKIATVNTTIYQDNELTPEGNYEYSVKAFDAAGNISAFSNLAVRDYEAPTAPGNLVFNNADFTSVSISWDAATDNMGVKGYKIYRDGVEAGSSISTTYTDTGLIPGKSYTYIVKAFDAGENLSSASNELTLSTSADLEKPSKPTNLNIYFYNTQAKIYWSEATDNVGVVGYEVYKNGLKIATVIDNQYYDNAASGDSYTVFACDAAGNYSESSDSYLFIDDFGNKKEDAASIDLGQEKVGYINYSGDNDYVKFTTTVAGSYLVDASTVPPGGYLTVELLSSSGSHLASDTFNEESPATLTRSLQGNSTYYVCIYETPMYGFDDQSEPPSPPANCRGGYRIKIYPADNEPPTPPANLTAVDKTATSLTLTWDAATDNIGVAGYSIYRDGLKIGDTSNLSYAVNGLLPNNTYIFAVKAYDLKGNFSIESTVQVSTETDTEPPTVPENLVVTEKNGRNTTLSWTASTDNKGLAGYELYRNGTKLVTVTDTVYSDNGLINGTYSYTVKAIDLAGNTSDSSNQVEVIVNEDITPPTAPQNLTASQIKLKSIYITWQASTDNVGVKWYYVYRDGKFINGGTGAFTGAEDFQVTPGATYQYYVRAVDAAGNMSEPSNTITVTSLQDTAAPTAPTNLRVIARGAESVSLKWNTSTDDVGVLEYSIFRNDIKVGTSTGLEFYDTGFDRTAVNTYYVKALDAAANLSQPSNSVIHEIIPPSIPQNLSLVSKTSRNINITWDASTDNVTVSGYEVFRDGTSIARTVYTSFSDNGLIPEQTYTYTVRSFDSVGNISNTSSALSVITDPDTIPPTIPQALSLVGYTGSTVSIKWNPSTDDYQMAKYEVFRNGTSVGQTVYSHFTDTVLNVGTDYIYTVKAIDSAGNVSDASSTLTAAPQLPQITRVEPPNNTLIGGLSSRNLRVYYKDTADTGETLGAEYSLDNAVWNNTGFAFNGPYQYDGSTQYFNCTWSSPLTASGKYTVRFTLTDSTAHSVQKVVYYQIDNEAPMVPKNLTAQPIVGGGGIQLAWDPPIDTDISYYQIYRSVYAEEGYTPLYRMSAGICSYTDRSALPGTKCYYKVSAVDVNGQESAASASANAIAPSDTVCPVVTSLYPAFGSGLGLNPVFTVNSHDNLGIKSTKLQYSLNDGVDWTDIGSTNGYAQFPWSTQGLSGQVKIRAIVTDYSDNVSDGTPVYSYFIDHDGPAKVTGLAGTPKATGVLLKWQDVPDNDLAYFQVEKATTQDGQFVVYQTTSRYLGMNVTGLTANTDYWFRVVAFDVRGNAGTYSDVVQVRTTEDTDSPVVTAIRPGAGYYAGAIPLSADAWDDVGVTSVKLQYSQDKVQWNDIETITPAEVAARVTVNYNWDTTTMAEGSYFVRAIAVDTNQHDNSTQNSWVEYRVNRSAPTDAPQGLTLTEAAGNLRLIWQNIDDPGLAGYKVYRAQGINGPFNQISSAALIGYYDYNVQPGITYYYKVAAYNAVGLVGPDSEIVSGKLLDDNEAPKIISVVPASGDTLPGNPEISALVSDNYKVATVELKYKSATEGDDWHSIAQRSVNKSSEVVAFTWNADGLSDGSYTLRLVVADAGGRVTESSDLNYNLKVYKVSPPVLTAVAADWKVNLSWTGEKGEYFKEYRIYRSTVTGQFYKLIKTTTDNSCCDDVISPEREYFYVVDLIDWYGNASRSAEVAVRPLANDPYAPTAEADEDQITNVGMDTQFDGSLSRDNDEISRYIWAFGDGSQVEESTPVHRYSTPGTYAVSLTVYDSAGNSSIDSCLVTVRPEADLGYLDIYVVDAANGLPLVGASVVVEGASGTRRKVLSGENGYIHTTVEVGSCKVYAYIKDYLPEQFNTTITKGETTNVTAKIGKGQLVQGEITVKRMTLEEIRDAGIDVYAPENQYVYQYNINLAVDNTCTYTLQANARGQVIRWTGPSNYTPSVLPHTGHPGVAPTLFIMKTPPHGTALWLKEFFEVSLVVQNMADPQFVIEQSSATLELPAGLSLAPTRDVQSFIIDMGSLAGGEEKQAKWIIRGDQKGDNYHVSANFKGVLQPFGDNVEARFQNQEPFRVWGGDAINMVVYAEDSAVKGRPYKIAVCFDNVSDHDVYNITNSLQLPEASWIPQWSWANTIETLKPGKRAVWYYIFLPKFTGRIKEDPFSNIAYMGGQSVKSRLVLVRASNRDAQNVITIADPIDPVTGAFKYDMSLLSLQGVRPLEFKVNYDSQSKTIGTMGLGWDHGFTTRLEQTGDGNLIIHWPQNQWSAFIKDTDNTYKCIEPSLKFDLIVKNPDGSYTLTRKDSSVYEFNAQGQFTSEKDVSGGALLYTYEEKQLKSITEPVSGCSLTFTYNEQGLLSQVTDNSDRSVSLQYDVNKNLTVITGLGNATTTFEYDECGRIVKEIDAQGQPVIINTYDLDGRVTAQTDREGRVTNLSYDTSSDTANTVNSTDRNGQAKTYSFDFNGNLVSQQDGINQGINFTYDDEGNCIKDTDAEGSSTDYTYDSRGNLLTISDGGSITSTMTYDERDNLLTDIDAAGQTTIYTYNSDNTRATKTDPSGNTTSYTYNENKQVTSITGPDGGVKSFTYENGLTKTITDETGRTTTYTYNQIGKPVSITNASGQTSTMEYDIRGNLISMTNPMGNTVSYTYDAMGWKTSETDARGNTTTFEYDSYGKVTAIKDALGNITRNEYDAEGRLLKTIDARGNCTTLTYDARGRLETTTNALGFSIRYYYDALDHITGIEDALGRRVFTQSYDGDGNPVTLTDSLGNTTTNQYDELGGLTQQIDATGHLKSYGYDQLGNLTSSYQAGVLASRTYDSSGRILTSTDPNDNKTTFTYDLAGRLLTQTSAAGGVISYTYNQAGLVATKTNARGQMTTYSYNAAGLLTSTTDQNGTTTYSYDANGNVLTKSDSTGTMTREYDVLNRVTKYTDVRGNIIRYQYDAVGNLTALTYPDGKQVHYEYDACNQLIRVTDWANRVTSYEYDPNGMLASTTRPDGSVETRSYDAMGQLTNMKDTDKNGQSLNEYSYAYDAEGAITTETDSAPEVNYTMPEKTMSYGPDNRLITYNEQTMTYDADGNMTNGPLKGQMANYTFDCRNRLISVGNTSYTYDAEDHRITVAENGSQTDYVVNPSNLDQILMRVGPDGQKTYYVYGLGLLGQENPDSTYQTYHYDYRGSTTAITDQDGAVTDRCQYGPYGELVSREGTTDTPFLYNGKFGVMTDNSGLYYMQARYYNPEIMRFINADVVLGEIDDPASMNRYAYANGQPINNTDPFGLCSKEANDLWNLFKLYKEGEWDGFWRSFKDMLVGLYDLSKYAIKEAFTSTDMYGYPVYPWEPSFYISKILNAINVGYDIYKCVDTEEEKRILWANITKVCDMAWDKYMKSTKEQRAYWAGFVTGYLEGTLTSIVITAGVGAEVKAASLAGNVARLGRGGTWFRRIISAVKKGLKKGGAAGEASRIFELNLGKFFKFVSKLDAESWGNRVFRNWEAGLTSVERQAIYDYTTDAYYQNINNVLRGIETDFAPGNAARVAEITNALDKALITDDIVVYRGVTREALGAYKSLPNDKLVGKLLEEKAFLSTSLIPEGAFDTPITYIIKVPKGIKGAFIENISMFGSQEVELLIQRGQRMIIQQVVENGSNLMLVMEIVPW